MTHLTEQNLYETPMKRILIIILLLCLTNQMQAKTAIDSTLKTMSEKMDFLSKQVSNDKHLLDSLSKEFNFLNRQSQFHIRTNEETISSISNQLSSSSYSLTIFGILFSIAGIGIGIYVTYIERKVVALNEQSKNQLEQTERIQREVNEVNKLIQSDIYGLFEKIKREETKHILNRLVKVPRDIGNLNDALLSRELEREDFDLLKMAYLKLVDEPVPASNQLIIRMNNKDSYLLQFFQHFTDLALKDAEIGPDFSTFYEHGISCAFENDILKTTEDFMKGIIDLGIQNKTKDINNFINGLAKSEFVDLDKLYEIMFESLKNRVERFKFYEIIICTTENKKCKVHFGDLLVSNYSNSELNLTEKGVISEIETLKTQ